MDRFTVESMHRQHWLGLALIVVIGGTLRFYQLGAKSIWIDEAFSIWVAHQPLADSWAWLMRLDQHPPLYYWLLHFWQRLFGDGAMSVRALSALCSTLALPLLYGATRHLTDHTTAWLATLLLAVSPLQLRYAQEARMYSLLTLTVAALLFCLVRLLTTDGRNQPQLWLGVALTQAATMWTHNTAAVFVPLALNLAVGGVLLWPRAAANHDAGWLEHKRAWLRGWLLAQGGALLLWLPWLPGFLQQSLQVDQAFWIQPPTFATVWFTLHNLQLAFLPGWFPLFSLWDFLIWAFAALGVYTLRHKPMLTGLLVSLFCVPILGELLISLRRPIFAEHTLLYIALPYWIVVAAGIRSLGHGAQRRAPFAGRAVPVVAVALLIGLASVGVNSYFRDFQKEQWNQATAYVVSQQQPGDLLLFNTTLAELPFAYYSPTAVGAMRRGVPAALFNGPVLEPVMTAADRPALQTLLTGQHRVWLIYAHEWYADPQGIILNELQQTMQLQQEQHFLGVRVLRFAAK